MNESFVLSWLSDNSLGCPPHLTGGEKGLSCLTVSAAILVAAETPEGAGGLHGTSRTHGSR